MRPSSDVPTLFTKLKTRNGFHDDDIVDIQCGRCLGDKWLGAPEPDLHIFQKSYTVLEKDKYNDTRFLYSRFNPTFTSSTLDMIGALSRVARRI